MSADDEDGLTSVVVEEATDQVDVGGLLDGDRIEDQLDGADLGASVGARVGEELGRAVGGAVGRQVYDALAAAVEEGRSREELSASLRRSVRSGLSEAARELGDRDSLAASVGDLLDDTDLRSELSDALSSDDDDATDEGDDDASAESSEKAADEQPPADAEAADVADLEALRRDTLEAFLDSISYRELQSIAKDVDVQANLSREEMTATIVESVSVASGDEEASDTEESTDAD